WRQLINARTAAEDVGHDGVTPIVGPQREEGCGDLDPDGVALVSGSARWNRGHRGCVGAVEGYLLSRVEGLQDMVGGGDGGGLLRSARRCGHADRERGVAAIDGVHRVV